MRKLIWIAAASGLSIAILFMLLELRLSGPFGQSVTVLSSSLRTAVRNLTVSTPPSAAGFSNPGPNVVIILLDCFRADYLDGATPRLSALADEAWSYERYFTSSSWTKPSSASLFTGLLPRKHGITRGEGYRLPQEAMTLAELGKQQGYTTAGFIQGIHLTRLQAFDQGFDHYVDQARRGSKSLLYQFFSWLAGQRPKRFLAYLHFSGTHDAYYYDNDLAAILAAPSYSGGVDFSNIDYKFAVADGELTLTAEQAAHLEFVARAKARRVDRQAVAAFLDRFMASKLAENTLLIITSDHGDGFNEHGTVSHGYTVYNEEIHAPLIIRLPPSFAAERGLPLSGREACPASTVDLVPTVLDFIGAPIPEGLDGASLIPSASLPEGCPRPVISEMAGGGRISGAAIIWDQLKLIVDYDEPGRRQLFDLSDDFAEARDLAAERPDDVARLAAELARRLNADGASMATWSELPSQPISEELRQEMRSLGYLD